MHNKTFPACQFPIIFRLFLRKRQLQMHVEAASQRKTPSCIWQAGQGDHIHAQTLKFRTGVGHMKKGSMTLCYRAYLLQTLSGTRY